MDRKIICGVCRSLDNSLYYLCPSCVDESLNDNFRNKISSQEEKCNYLKKKLHVEISKHTEHVKRNREFQMRGEEINRLKRLIKFKKKEIEGYKNNLIRVNKKMQIRREEIEKAFVNLNKIHYSEQDITEINIKPLKNLKTKLLTELLELFQNVNIREHDIYIWLFFKCVSNILNYNKHIFTKDMFSEKIKDHAVNYMKILYKYYDINLNENEELNYINTIYMIPNASLLDNVKNDMSKKMYYSD